MSGPVLPIGDVSPARYFAGVAVVLGVLFASVAGGDGGGGHVWWQWQLQTCIPIVILVAVHRSLHQWSRFDALDAWWKLVISGVVGATLFAPIAVGIDVVVGEPLGASLMAELWDEWQGVTPPVTIAWIAINAPWVLGFRLTRGQAPGQNTAAPPPMLDPAATAHQVADQACTPLRVAPSLPPVIVDLLPKPLPGRLLFIRSELHYLHLQTTEGKALVLYSLRDAIAQLGEQGFQPHRSYWVAHDAIRAFERKGRQGELVLVDGSRIPVSRRQLDAVGAMTVNGSSG